MLKLFQYNWQVRDEWFTLCESMETAQLTLGRVGGMGSILRTLWHIVDAEHSWIRAIEGEPDEEYPFEEYQSLQQIRAFSRVCAKEVRAFIHKWDGSRECEQVEASWRSGETFAAGDILRHIIAHEIHHIGQLSVWVREIGIEPVSANLLWRVLADERANGE